MTKLVVKFDDGGNTGNLNTGTGASAAMQGFQQGNAYGMIAQGVGGLANKFPTPNADLNGNNQMAAQIRDGVSNALLSSGNPYAMVAGAAVKVLDKTGGFSDVSEGLGAGNDIGNAIMSFALPGAGWFMKPTTKYEMSADMQVMGSGYQGSMKDASKAEANSGAKLWFGRGKAEGMIAQAKSRDARISDIKAQRDMDFQTARSMTQNKAMANQYALQGGYRQQYARAGKFGLKLERAKQLAIKFREPSEIKEQQQIVAMKDGGKFFTDLITDMNKPVIDNDTEFFDSLIQSLQKGGKVEKKEKNDETYKEFLSTLPENLQQGNDGEDGYRMRYLFDNSPNVWNFQDALNEKLFELNSEDNTYHGFSIFPSTGEFLKSKNHPTIKYELDWYNGDSEEAKKFREEYDLVTEEDGKPLTYYKYKKKVTSHKEGGQMNVIPEGSLHARLHHMENADNLTKKGIPVVDNEGNQQAEIEHSEIIFTKEVTEKLEELYKKFKSDEYTNKEKENFAIEAGKLLSKEIIENTDDRVGLLNDNENETLANN